MQSSGILRTVHYNLESADIKNVADKISLNFNYC